MSDFDNLDEHISTRELKVTSLSLDYLNFTGKWASFLAIMGFIFIGLLVIVGLYQIISFAPISARLAMTGMLYLGLAFAYVFPCLYLLRFSKRIREAQQAPTKHTLEYAFENLKSFFKFTGIFTIVLTISYIVLFAYSFYVLSQAQEVVYY